MLKTPIDPTRYILGGPTMGTHWTALFHANPAVDLDPIHAALARCVDVVDRQMSTWKPDSDLMRINRAPVGLWQDVPAELLAVLTEGLDIGRRSGGAFDIAMGDLVTAWSFGPDPADSRAIRAALGQGRPSAHEVLELDPAARKLRKLAPVALDLSGIAKGFAVDLMTDTLRRFGIESGLLGLDGEMRGFGLRPDGTGWSVAVERPDYDARTPLSMIALQDSAVATSGDYRHWVEVGPRRLSHTMDPARGGPLGHTLASVTVLANTCMAADAWATALMVAGVEKGTSLAQQNGLAALFLQRKGAAVLQTRVGW
ncbi:thiamine biosynthesis lipoprotein [Pseudorhodobacter antarcticus]|uniref:FAD:protein FMN transferase n=1 Tax=Pseudorhodobacter antarcticus TaxID=1077947 RepID=A0A1H8K0V1_9RHOB|nr:FAD:protein FMN transferase [Pseudorhodobacter antarcticus]SEN86415.1 thiamine biosynthesis lipoprotein [Pseudorhodobacter antarcticus]